MDEPVRPEKADERERATRKACRDALLERIATLAAAQVAEDSGGEQLTYSTPTYLRQAALALAALEGVR